MPIPVSELSDKQLLEVLSFTEGHFLDLKAKEISREYNPTVPTQVGRFR
jgi:hypothetical protein